MDILEALTSSSWNYLTILEEHASFKFSIGMLHISFVTAIVLKWK